MIRAPARSNTFSAKALCPRIPVPESETVTAGRKMQCTSFTVFQMRQSVADFCASLREVIEYWRKKERKKLHCSGMSAAPKPYCLRATDTRGDDAFWKKGHFYDCEETLRKRNRGQEEGKLTGLYCHCAWCKGLNLIILFFNFSRIDASWASFPGIDAVR